MAVTALTDLETLEVSLVAEGANLKKRFPILKRTEQDKMSDTLHAILDAPSGEDRKFDNVTKSASLGDEAASAVKGALKILSAYADAIPVEESIALVAKGLDVPMSKAEQDEFEEGKESEGTTLSDEDKIDKEEEEDEEEKTEEEKAQDEFEEGKESEGTTLSDEDRIAKPHGGEHDEDELTKDSLAKSLGSLPADVQAKIDLLFKNQQEAVAKAVKLEKSLRVERDERLRKEFVQKAEKQFPYVPGKTPEELGLLLKTLHAVDPKISSDLESVLKSVSEVIEKGNLFEELGSSRYDDGTVTAYSRLDAFAKESVAKSGGSYAKAFETAMKSNPELYSQYLDEQGQ